MKLSKAYRDFKKKAKADVKYGSVTNFGREHGCSRQMIYNCFLIADRDHNGIGRIIARFMGFDTWRQFMNSYK